MILHFTLIFVLFLSVYGTYMDVPATAFLNIQVRLWLLLFQFDFTACIV